MDQPLWIREGAEEVQEIMNHPGTVLGVKLMLKPRLVFFMTCGSIIAART